MLALSFTFPAGRYHATPWDRNVNEGAVAWPPDPWRILRALIATWHHKVKHWAKHSESTLRGLVESLSAELPAYSMPAASHSHTRHYMPQFSNGESSLIFDAFTAVRRRDPLAVVWPNVELPDAQRMLLDDLLSVIGYLGRAESWVEGKRLTESPAVNCVPGTALRNTQTGEVKGEVINLYAPMTSEEYRSMRQQFLGDKKSEKMLDKTLPDSLLDALTLETGELRKQGWSQPPAAREVSYLRYLDARRVRYAPAISASSDIATVSFILVGMPLPLVEDTLRIGELMRMAVMSRAKRVCGEDSIPSIFSGHGMPAGNRHGHVFYLPWDSNGDGCIDRVVLHAPGGMQGEARRVVEGIKRLWTRDGCEWRLVLECIGDVACALTQRSNVWESITPYLHPWHRKKLFDVAAQIKRECRERGLPEPTVLESVEEVEVGNRSKRRMRRPIHFQRFRSRTGLSQPDRLGSFWRLTFPEPVQGPLALGFACHFGLGLFVPVRSAG